MNVTVSQKGWVVIPAILRKKYGLMPGVHLHVVDYRGSARPVARLQGPGSGGCGNVSGR
jgi:bifunctional DNA-binding transcriptional regulator/antitoxin component of YhaV-PrlF toxin-antitoxin module